MVNESKKILNMPYLKVNSFCCRVPTTVGHGVFVNIICKQDFCIEDVKQMLSQEQNIIVMDDNESLYPTPLTVRNTKYVEIGRIYKDLTNKRGVNMFIVADNLLRGAAYNAYEILEYIMENADNA